jgi:hypothetical protein
MLRGLTVAPIWGNGRADVFTVDEVRFATH